MMVPVGQVPRIGRGRGCSLGGGCASRMSGRGSRSGTFEDWTGKGVLCAASDLRREVSRPCAWEPVRGQEESGRVCRERLGGHPMSKERFDA